MGEFGETKSNKCSEFLKNPHNKVRLGYATIFTISVVIALLMRAIAQKVFDRLYSFECTTEDCYGKVFIFRVSFALFVFFFLHLLITIGYNGTDEEDFRTKVQNRLWGIKIILIIGLIIASIFIPDNFFTGWARACQYLSAIFLIMQLVYLIGWAYDLNSTLVDKEMLKTLIGLTITLTLVAIGIIVISYVFFSRSGCTRNTVFITLTLIFAIVHYILAIRVENGSLFVSSIVFVYSGYLVFSAIMSQPENDCNPFSHTQGGVIQLIPGIVIAIVAISYCSFNLSSQSSTFKISKDDSKDLGYQGDLEQAPYSYWFFHFVYASASLYMAMLLTGWDISDTSSSFSVDVSWTSMWVKMGCQWLVIILYTWSLVAPLVLKDRDFD
ncbi:tms1 isoform f [Anaeramoeba ignava]|uniref:Tms1 isoform f n=1 Tax=Anaeramoeba ignava TaxID=1746090 RepID=A0A9Q0LPS3_ANAIG|nr:tms1 isoform f [Anaeramoeba ignava]|eukprot:Anaeramoba_ignava/a221195_108.p1 GENE.a221195_108~~a221195_108.p1  ORF type:complete len:383 (+),score=67.37 a221195_108:27-1175(+)